jgi:hypothetical protein
MPAAQLDYLSVFTVRRGPKQWAVAYYRRGGVKTRLKDGAGKPVDPGDHDALVKAWQAAHVAYEKSDLLAAQAAEKRALIPGSIAALIALYRASPEWVEKKPRHQA